MAPAPFMAMWSIQPRSIRSMMWRLTPAAQHVRAHHQDAARRSRLAACASATVGEVGMLERRSRVVEREPVDKLQVVRALGERLDLEARAVEEFVSGHGRSYSLVRSPACPHVRLVSSGTSDGPATGNDRYRHPA